MTTNWPGVIVASEFVPIERWLAGWPDERVLSGRGRVLFECSSGASGKYWRSKSRLLVER